MNLVPIVTGLPVTQVTLILGMTREVPEEARDGA